jgi:hypothetical protein
MTLSVPPQRTRRYWMRLARFFVIVLVGTLVILPFLLGFVSMWALTHPGCNPGSDPGWFNPDYEQVRFDAPRGIIQQGYFMPGTNGATVMVVPAYGNGRGSDLHYAQVFNEAGFNVLTFDSRACTSQRWHSLGYQEVGDVLAGYDYLKTRPEIDAGRVGLHGFSSAGATSMMSAAQLSDIRSVSAEGGYHDFRATLGLTGTTGFFDRLFQWGAVLAYGMVTGGDIADLSPLEAIDSFGERPLLLIYGSREVSLGGAREMHNRAVAQGVRAELWVVPGAGHGNYLSLARDEFISRVTEFHRAALLGAF